MTIKLLQRYSAVTKTGVETVCLDADVSALEAENERLREERKQLVRIIQLIENNTLDEYVLQFAKEAKAILNREQEE